MSEGYLAVQIEGKKLGADIFESFRVRHVQERGHEVFVYANGKGSNIIECATCTRSVGRTPMGDKKGRQNKKPIMRITATGTESLAGKLAEK